MSKIYGDTVGGGGSKLKNVPQSDWAQTDNTQPDYIKNKPESGQIFEASNENGVLTLKAAGAICEKATSYDVAVQQGFEGTHEEWTDAVIITKSAIESATAATEAAISASANATKAETAADQAMGFATEAKAAALSMGDFYANALKGTASDKAIVITDVSPIEHEMGVKVSGVSDVSAVKVLAYGKNLFDKDTSKLKLLDSPLYEGETGAYGHYGFALENLPAGTYTISAVRARETVIEGVAGRYLYVAKKGGKKYPFSNNVGKKVTVTLDMSEGETLVIFNDYGSLNYGNLENTILTFAEYDIQIECGATATDIVPYITPTEYAVNADGTVDGVTAIHPTTTLMTDTAGAVIDCTYSRDINKVYEQLTQAIVSLGGNV